MYGKIKCASAGSELLSGPNINRIYFLQCLAIHEMALADMSRKSTG